MYQLCIRTASALHGPSSFHSIASGNTLAAAISNARARIDTYGRINPGHLFYRRPNDGAMYPLVIA